MGTISLLAAEIKGKKIQKTFLDDYKRLIETLERFNNDFKDVIGDLIKCEVKYEPCFWYKSEKDGQFHIFPPETKLDLKMNGGSGGICIADSILFTFDHHGEERKKRLFYTKKEGWHFIARRGNFMNDTYQIKDHRKDLILYLDQWFDGEYK